MDFSFIKIDHIGIAVRDIDQALETYKSDYGLNLLVRENSAAHNTELAFIELPGTTVELLAPLNDQSGVASFLNDRGPGLHHICYEVDSIENTLLSLKSKGYQLIDTVPRPGARGSQIAFIHPKSCNGVLTEVCSYEALAEHTSAMK